MKDTDWEKPAQRARPAWVDEPDVVEQGRVRPRRERLPRPAVPGKHEDDGLWEHVGVTGGARSPGHVRRGGLHPAWVPLWMISLSASSATARRLVVPR